MKGYDLNPAGHPSEITGRPARLRPAAAVTTGFRSLPCHRARIGAVGGFCELYQGYGGEDTDFAMLARQAGLGLTWVGGAAAYHQWHPAGSPPVEHLTDIVRNAALFAERWGWWPMGGWFTEFEALGLARRTSDGGWEVANDRQVGAEPAGRSR